MVAAQLEEKTPTFRFQKKERLCSLISINNLFKINDTSFSSYPVRFIIKVVDVSENTPENQVLISVPRRNFKKAVTRNLLKRRIREAYRLHKQLISVSTHQNKCLHIGIIYTAKEILPFADIEKKVISAITKLNTWQNSSAKSAE